LEARIEQAAMGAGPGAKLTTIQLCDGDTAAISPQQNS
jgi:hypothetical protein